jgi:DNA-directed RNA polymerase subunit L
MQINVLRKENDLLEIGLKDEETLPQVIASFASKEIDCAAVKEHPLMATPKIIAHGKDPRKALLKACEEIIVLCEEMKKHFKREIANK